MAEEALASLGALPLTRTRLMTWPPRLRALSNIAFRSGSVEFSCTAGTRATGPSARAGIANAATIVTRAETGSDRLVGLFIASFLSVGPVQGRNPLGLRFLRRFRLARTVEGDRLANERLEGGLVNFFSFVDVYRAAYVSVEARVEETGRILQRRALGAGKLHGILVGFAGADDAVVRPHRSARILRFHPLPLLDHVRVGLLDELPHSAERFPAPVAELGDSLRDQLRCRLALVWAGLFHVVILEGAVQALGGVAG